MATPLQQFPPDLTARLELAIAQLRHGQARHAALDLETLRTELHALDPALGALAGSHLAEALVAAGQRSRAVQVLGEDAAKVRAPEFADIRARLLLQASPLHPDPEFGLQLAAEADRLATTLDDPQPRVHTIENLLTLLDRQGLTQGVREVADGLAVQARHAGDRPAQVRGLLRVALYDHEDGKPNLALDGARAAHACAALLPDADHALRAEAAALHGQLARETGQLLEAVEALDEALLAQASPDDHTRLLRALAALGLGLDPRRTVAELQQVTHSPDQAVADRAKRALVLYRLDAGDIAAAEALLPQLAPSSQPAVQARLLLGKGRLAEAQVVLRQLAEATPGDLGVQIALADVMRRQEQVLPALQLLDDGLAQATANGDGHGELRLRLARGPLLGQLGDRDGSRQDARRAAEIALQLHLPLHHVRARTHIAHALARLDLLDDALAELDRAATVAAQIGADVAAVQAALCAALLDAMPVQLAVAHRPLDVLAALDTLPDSAVPAVAVLALARRAVQMDGDAQTALALLHHAERSEPVRLRLPIAQLRLQLFERGGVP